MPFKAQKSLEYLAYSRLFCAVKASGRGLLRLSGAGDHKAREEEADADAPQGRDADGQHVLGGAEDADYWTVYNLLPRETRGYVPAFIAATYIMNYYCDHGITPMEASLPTETDTVIVTKEVGFNQIASVCGVTVEELRALNPQYRRDIIPVDYALRMPNDAIETFILNEDSIYASGPVIRRKVIDDINEAPATTARAKTTTRTRTTAKRATRNTRARAKTTTRSRKTTARRSTAKKAPARKSTAKRSTAKKTASRKRRR